MRRLSQKKVDALRAAGCVAFGEVTVLLPFSTSTITFDMAEPRTPRQMLGAITELVERYEAISPAR